MRKAKKEKNAVSDSVNNSEIAGGGQSAASGSDLPVTLSIDDSSDVINIGINSFIGTRASQQDSTVIGIGNDIGSEFNGKFIAAVCDGMGGLEGGEQASSLCAKTFFEDFFSNPALTDYPSFFKDELDKIDYAVSELKRADGRSLGAGSTMVSVIIDRGQLYWGCVGDSRIYIARGREIVQVNRDHNYHMILKEKVKNGEITDEEANSHSKREALVSYMGMNGLKFMDVNDSPFKMQPEDCVILCSDGLYRLVSENEMLDILSIYPRNMTDAAKAMVDAATEKMAPHQDNTSVIIFKYI